jgi:hypothetical protein
MHLESIGVDVRWVGEPFFFHKSHPVHWKQESLKIGRQMLHEQYGIPIEHPYWEEWRRGKPFSKGVAV